MMVARVKLVANLQEIKDESRQLEKLPQVNGSKRNVAERVRASFTTTVLWLLRVADLALTITYCSSGIFCLDLQFVDCHLHVVMTVGKGAEGTRKREESG